MPESPDFDPYLKWLGIRESTRPINHYRLLGLDLYESDPDVIAMASDRQMAHIRTYQSGPNGDMSQQILSELARARRCLLMPEKKSQYDAQLQSALNPAPQRPTVRPVAPPSAPGAIPVGRLIRSPRQNVPSQLPPQPSAIPTVRATHPPADFQSVQPPPIPPVSPTFAPFNQVPTIGIRTDVNARKKIRKRERNQLVWTLASWVAGGVAAIGVAAYCIAAGVVPNPFAAVDKGDGSPNFVSQNDRADRRSESRNRKRDAKLKDRVADPAISVLWDKTKIQNYQKPDEIAQELLGKVNRGIVFGQTVRLVPSLEDAGDHEVLFVPKPGRLLIGFAYSTDSNGRMRGLQPILLSPDSAYVAGEISDSDAKYIVAEPGYAVGAMKISALDPMNCFRITFMKINENGLDPDNSYLSKLQGENRGPLTNVANKVGIPIVGVYTRIVDNVRIATLGLVGVDFAVERGFDAIPANRDRYKPKSSTKASDPNDAASADPARPSIPRNRRDKGSADVAVGEPNSERDAAVDAGDADIEKVNPRSNRPDWFGGAKEADEKPKPNPADEGVVDKDDRIPIPGKRERDNAVKAMEGQYAAMAEAARRSRRNHEFRRMAEQMVLDSQGNEHRDAAQYAILENALKLTKSIGEAEMTLEIVREISDRFQVEFWDLAFESMKDTVPNLKGAEQVRLQANYKKTMRGLIEEAIEKRLYRQAQRFAIYASRLGSRTRDQNLTLYTKLKKDIDYFIEVSDRALSFSKQLKANPEDPAANDAYGYYLFVIEDDLKGALGHWKFCDNQELKDVAVAELALDDANGKGLEKLGDQWRSLGKSNRNIFQRRALSRASDIYRDAISNLDRGDALDVRDKLKEVEKLLVSTPSL